MKRFTQIVIFAICMLPAIYARADQTGHGVAGRGATDYSEFTIPKDTEVLIEVVGDGELNCYMSAPNYGSIVDFGTQKAPNMCEIHFMAKKEGDYKLAVSASGDKSVSYTWTIKE